MLLAGLIPFLKENSPFIKIHFAKGADDPEEAVKAFLLGNFKEWQEEQSGKNFECDYILSLIQLDKDEWLFAGLFECLGSRKLKDGNYKYRTKQISEGSDLVGRAIVQVNRWRNSYCWLDTYIDSMDVVEVRRNVYTKPFPGYENVCITWKELYTVIDTDEWKIPLKNMKGVYLITDTSNGFMYVGSATGERKIWGRWKSYIRTGHGGNAGLKELSMKHIKENFRYTILDVYTAKTNDEDIRLREKWWKNVLMTNKNFFGYNHN